MDEVTDPHRAVEIAGTLMPEIILTADAPHQAITAPFVRELRRRCPRSLLVVLAHDTPSADALDAMVEVGISACILWRDMRPATFDHVLALILEGRLRFGSEAVAEAFRAARQRRRQPDASALPLSPRQREVLNLIVQGMTNQEIATRLDISSNTVASHVEDIKKRLDVTTRADVIAIALRHGLPER